MPVDFHPNRAQAPLAIGRFFKFILFFPCTPLTRSRNSDSLQLASAQAGTDRLRPFEFKSPVLLLLRSSMSESEGRRVTVQTTCWTIRHGIRIIVRSKIWALPLPCSYCNHKHHCRMSMALILTSRLGYHDREIKTPTYFSTSKHGMTVGITTASGIEFVVKHMY